MRTLLTHWVSSSLYIGISMVPRNSQLDANVSRKIRYSTGAGWGMVVLVVNTRFRCIIYTLYVNMGSTEGFNIVG